MKFDCKVSSKERMNNVKLQDVPVKILGISGSPRRNGSTEVMLEKALEGVASVGNIEVVRYSFAGKKMEGCIFCNACRDTGICYKKDNFQELSDMWLDADGIIYSTPVFHTSIPAQLKAFIDRLGHTLCAHFNRFTPRFCKVGGILAVGSSRFGGQELTIQMLVNHLLTMNCIPVPGDGPNSYLGAPGLAMTWEKGSVREDKIALETAFNVGQRVAEVTKMVKAAYETIDNLPVEYKYKELDPSSFEWR